MIRGMTFDATPVVAGDDAALYQNSLKDGVYKGINNEFAATALGLVITVQSGYVSILGRQIANDANQDVTIDGGTVEGFLIVKIDLNQLPGSQVSLTFKQDTTFPTLTQDDLNAGGTIYEYVLYKYTSDGVSVTLTDERKYTKRPNIKKDNVELLSGSWSLIVGGTYDGFYEYDIADVDILESDVAFVGPEDVSDVDSSYNDAGFSSINETSDGSLKVRVKNLPSGSVFINYYLDRGVE